MRIAGCILAGGKSSRMGVDKASVLLGGKPLMTHIIDRLRPQVDELAINTNDIHVETPFEIIRDNDVNIAGPLAGVQVALQWAKTQSPAIDALVTVPIDSPFFPPDLVEQFKRSSKNTVAVAMRDDQLHPTFALWPLTIEPQLNAWLSTAENRSAMRFLSTIQHTVVLFDNNRTYDPFMNINTPQDLADAEVLLNRL